MDIQNSDYQSFVGEIKVKIREAQYRALKAVNKELIQLYWELGKMIVERQAEFGWGKSIIGNLSKDLQKEFPNENGFGHSNLWAMRQFYVGYQDITNLQPLVGEIGWTHNIIILQKCKTVEERKFYILHTKKFGWTKNILLHQIESKAFEMYLTNQTNFDQLLPKNYAEQAHLAVKDHYTFDFLDLGHDYSERELEETLVKNIRKFLIEMGSAFTFVGNQFCLKVSDNEYFIDLLLFNRKLKCMVAIDLKIDAFKPEYKGKMEFYLSVLNDKYKEEGENDAIGIIICKEKDRTIVEYSFKNSQQPIGVATYNTSSLLPEQFKGLLPSPEEISNRLNDLENII
ncbi:MAG: PDDEXK nuclease domain-containing protein [Arcicella sp.]|nr:PDDEXK nuclease domain-containing protein [Arcicella sp.]